ncbi:MAG TPA: class I SAM-dependent methyltransferase [Bryobacteraceae bacterium]|nr:class I SAM-dependent methyltransferase [Bryobacteraceae bacterium]
MTPVATDLNRLCQLEDFADPRIEAAIRAIHPDYLSTLPSYPRGYEHRKAWEYAQLMLGLESLDPLTPESLVLSVAAGQERPLYELTNRVKLVFATDIYGASDFSDYEAAGKMLADPDFFAPFPYNRNRLVVQYMNALDLRFEDNTFDLVFSLSSIEHFGGYEPARRSLQEMHRVCRPGGIVMITTECVFNGVHPPQISYLQLFTPRLMEIFANSVPGLEPVGPLRFDISDLTRSTVRNYDKAIDDRQRGIHEYPHVALELAGCHFTSFSLFLRKTCA